MKKKALMLLILGLTKNLVREVLNTPYNIDFQKREFIDNLNSLDKEKSYIIYCQSGIEVRRLV